MGINVGEEVGRREGASVGCEVGNHVGSDDGSLEIRSHLGDKNIEQTNGGWSTASV